MLRRGAEVRVSVHQRAPIIKDPRIETVPADFAQLDDCRRAMRGVQYVFHAAGAVSAAAVTAGNAMSAINVNLILTAQTLQAAWMEGVERYQVFSSSTGYPAADHAIKEEEMWTGPTYPAYFGYGWMRRYLERISEFVAAKSSMKIALVRPTAVYGRWDNFDPVTSHVIPALIRRAVEKQEPFVVWGTGEDVPRLPPHYRPGARLSADAGKARHVRSGEPRLRPRGHGPADHRDHPQGRRARRRQIGIRCDKAEHDPFPHGQQLEGPRTAWFLPPDNTGRRSDRHRTMVSAISTRVRKNEVPALGQNGIAGLGNWLRRMGHWRTRGRRHGLRADGRSRVEARLRRAFDLGVNLFDTADLYGLGHGEELMGQELHDVRGQVLLATKAGFIDAAGKQDFSGPYLRSALECSLKRLRSEYVDVFHLHSPPIDILEKDDAVISTLEWLRREGKVRAIGISARNPEEALVAAERMKFDSIQVNFNLVNQRALDNGLLPLCEQRGIGVVIRTPLCFGFLTGGYSDPSDFRSHRSPQSLVAGAGAEMERRLPPVRRRVGGNQTADERAIRAPLLPFRSGRLGCNPRNALRGAR